MQNIVEVVKGSWLDSWPGTMQDKVDQMDMVET